jgi:hypothetical protein
MVDTTFRESLEACRCPSEPHADDEAVISFDHAKAGDES